MRIIYMKKEFKVCDLCKRVDIKDRGVVPDFIDQHDKNFCSFECAIKWHRGEIERLEKRQKRWKEKGWI